MLNIDAFLIRLEQLMENNQLNAAAFAEKIGVQRSSVSHILSRRNKPSLEFILKIHAEFEEADFDWLLLGVPQHKPPTLDSNDKIPKAQIEFPPTEVKQPLTNQKTITEINTTEITQIIQVYKDGTFDVFMPKS